MAIKQLNCAYVPLEDRVLLRVNTDQDEQYGVWLTRAVCRNLLATLLSAERAMLGIGEQAPMGNDAMIQDFRREGELAEADFSQRYEGARKAPLGPAPVLATEFQVINEHGLTTLHAELATKRRISITLPPKLVHGLIKMLLDVQRKGDWGLEPESSLSGAGVSIRH